MEERIKSSKSLQAIALRAQPDLPRLAGEKGKSAIAFDVRICSVNIAKYK